MLKLTKWNLHLLDIVKCVQNVMLLFFNCNYLLFQVINRVQSDNCQLLDNNNF